MKPHAPLTCNIHPPPPPLRPPPKRSLPVASCPPPPPLSFLRRSASPLCLRPRPSRNIQVPEAVRFDGPFIGSEAEVEGMEVEGETVVTRTLPPAVTLERGLQCIKEAVEELKFNPPPSRRGVLRFQVAVPPGPKALSWFCCQPESSGVFPTFFLSNENEESPSFKSLSVNNTRGVFGIGTAVYFSHSATGSPGEPGLLRRYLSSDSSFTTSYGFMDASFDMELSSLKHETGSFYLVVPQIELHEHEDISALSATLAWDEIFSFTFSQAIQSLESSLFQATSHFWPSTEWCHFDSKYYARKRIDLPEDDFVQLVSVNAPVWASKEHNHDSMEPTRSKRFHQFCFRLSSSVGLTRNVLDDVQEISYSFQRYENINAVWASLLVEECCRLGLTYFCIAPGSRSSPLAIAASAHPHATCIACFDERSLAFHAIGYARGSRKPAVVITTSGTAVSNLLPAVVEASQDLLPLLLLTADRPPELQEVGANQAINQVNHFGSFVRFFFSLPAPSDIIPARMVLTTLDSAVYRAMSSPNGPVHVNCPFREPLDDCPNPWMPSCLQGLDFWMSSAQPFTRYFQLQNVLGSSFPSWIQFKEVFKVIQDAGRGLLLLGSIHTEDEIWAALLLAKHLNWPVAPDILSGLRLRKILSFLPEANENIFFIDHLDHALLSATVRALFRLDIVIQLGSRITSKRISQMLEESYPRTYLLIENHPYRHDPSHLVTHRLQCSIAQFVDSLMNTNFSFKSSSWCHDLRTIESMVSRDVSFRVNAEISMSEPFVVHTACKMLTAGSALFIGNSMAIRDADMYGCSWKSVAHGVADVLLYPEIPFLPVRVAGNRGASGIDGLISTAVGFSVGSNKRVLCIVGDVSFLHDTNGLAILNQRMLRKPMTIIVINNHGGAIFSFLPIADRTDASILDQYFYTSHSASIQKLCHAHGVKHLLVKTKLELRDALLGFQHEMTDFVIEVESNIDSNSTFHSSLRKSACQAANDAYGALSRLSTVSSFSGSSCKILRMEFSLYRIQLSAPSTLSFLDRDSYGFDKEGYVISLFLEDGRVGYGEVAPLYRESLLDVEQQLRFLVHVIEGATIPFAILLLNGSFASWISNNLGIPKHTVHPSVRCGLEMAILSAMGTRDGSSFLGIVKPSNMDDDLGQNTSSSVMICALLDSGGTPDEVAHVAYSLVNEGFTAIKLKVARREDPVQDAAVVKEVRKKIGVHIELRVDANRNWAYEEAMKFSSLVKDCDLRYIEEPVQEEDDILKYHEESGLPVALDETIDSIQGNTLSVLDKYVHPGIVALVIKPSVVGGFERAALIAKWAHYHGKLAVMSSAFESSLGLSNYILFSHYLDVQNAAVVEVKNRGQQVAHGLGTYKWLLQDVAPISLRVHKDPCTGSMGASVAEATQLLQNFHVNENVICTNFKGEEVHSYHMTAITEDFSCSLKVHEVGGGHDNVVVFLHGFLGSGDEWIPIMKAISGFAKCISIDLPGHGDSKVKANATEESGQRATWSVEKVADLLSTLIQDITPAKTTLVGYSMGARIALHLALRLSDKVNGTILISGSPGLKDSTARKVRRAKDDSKAKNLIAYGLDRFLEDWYAGELWKSLRSHPHFKKVVASRLLQDDIHNLAEVLSGLSIGRQRPLWEDLKHCTLPLLFIVGEEDFKFKSIAREMCNEIDRCGKHEANMENSVREILEVPDTGHAVHLENPLAVIKALGKFLTSLR